MHIQTAPALKNPDVAVLISIMIQKIRMRSINLNVNKQVRCNLVHPHTREVLDTEVFSLLPHCPEWFQAYIRLIFLTGLRQGDMLSIRLDQFREDGLFIKIGKRDKRILFTWTPDVAHAIETIGLLRHRANSMYIFISERRATRLTMPAWNRAMTRIFEAKAFSDSFAENDLRAKVATEAIEFGQNATAMLGHSSDAVTKRHYPKGTQKS